MQSNKIFGEALKMIWLPILLIVVWWIASGASQNFYFPPLADIVGQIIDDAKSGVLWNNLAFSVGNYTVGFLGALGLAVVIGVVLGSNRAVREAVSPLLDFMRSMPQIALVPVVIMALGIGAAPKMFLIGFICFWPILLNTIDGVRGINPQLLEVSRGYRIPYSLYLRRVVLPGATPSIMAGIRVALGLGVVMLVVSEMYSSTRGIGFYILQSQESYRITSVWAGTVVIGLLGYLISLGFLVFERFALAWYFQHEPLRKKRPQPVGPSGRTGSSAPQAASTTAAEDSSVPNPTHEKR